jgi:chromosome segregation ATPase
VADTKHKFAELEKRLRKAVEVFKEAQTEKRALERELEKLKSVSKGDAKGYSTLERELQFLRREREEVRSRIEKLIEQIDGLTKPDAQG